MYYFSLGNLLSNIHGINAKILTLYNTINLLTLTLKENILMYGNSSNGLLDIWDIRFNLYTCIYCSLWIPNLLDFVIDFVVNFDLQ